MKFDRCRTRNPNFLEPTSSFACSANRKLTRDGHKIFSAYLLAMTNKLPKFECFGWKFDATEKVCAPSTSLSCACLPNLFVPGALHLEITEEI